MVLPYVLLRARCLQTLLARKKAADEAAAAEAAAAEEAAAAAKGGKAKPKPAPAKGKAAPPPEPEVPKDPVKDVPVPVFPVLEPVPVVVFLKATSEVALPDGRVLTGTAVVDLLGSVRTRFGSCVHPVVALPPQRVHCTR